MKRKEFIKQLGGFAVLATSSAYLLSCSSSDDSNNDNNNNDANSSTRNCLENGARGNINNNHGHTLVVPKADVEAGVEKTYNIQGTSSHTHSVTVTTANFEALSNNQNAVTASTNNADHSHSVTIVCA